MSFARVDLEGLVSSGFSISSGSYVPSASFSPAMGLCCQFSESIYSLGSSQGCLRSLWPTIQLDIKQSHCQKLRLATRHGQLGWFSSLFDNFMQLTIIYVNILGSLDCIRFSSYISNGLIISYSLSIFLPLSPSYFSLPTSSSHSSPTPSIHRYLFYFFFLGRSVYSPSPYAVPNFCSSTDYSSVIINT